jgi:hypothetical protein
MNYNSTKGFLKINLYLNNEWIPIYIDDKLPTENNEISSICSGTSDKNNLWLAYIEKAFAK